jgi:hypothetical protein
VHAEHINHQTLTKSNKKKKWRDVLYKIPKLRILYIPSKLRILYTPSKLRILYSRNTKVFSCVAFFCRIAVIRIFQRGSDTLEQYRQLVHSQYRSDAIGLR